MKDSRWAAMIFGVIALAGLALYLWPALHAPVTVWSDSTIDLELARRGAGLRPPTAEEVALAGKHPIKPLWILFLRGAAAAFPGLPRERAAVLGQSLLLWAAITFSAGWVLRRRGFTAGIALLLLLLSFLRLRDASGVVLSEALSAALLLPAVVLAALPVRTAWMGLLLGGAGAVLFWIRPNVGGILLLLLLGLALFRRRWATASLAAVGFAVVVSAVFLATRPPAGTGAWRGLDWPVLYGSADDSWEPSLLLDAAAQNETPRERMHRTLRNWRSTLRADDPDRARQLLWRSLHGLFGVEYADERWSAPYAAADRAVRALSPWLMVLATALILSLPFRGELKELNVAGVVLLAAIVGQSLLLGSLPRYVLPFLPVVLFLALLAAIESSRAHRRRSLAVAALAAIACTAVLALYRGIPSQEWGRVEAAGVSLRQEIRRGTLPRRAPATLHIRIASPLPRHGSHFEVLWGERSLYDSREDSRRHRPEISIELPEELLSENARAATILRLRSSGSYGPHEYLLFPVVPRPWGPPAKRDGEMLSPSTGARSGALDWWAHPGRDPGD